VCGEMSSKITHPSMMVKAAGQEHGCFCHT
jgi:hypothetical protein